MESWSEAIAISISFGIQSCPPTRIRFELALTDTDVTGHKHGSNLPKGKMDPKVGARQVESGKGILPAFKEVCAKVQEPFISTINDCMAPKVRYYNQ